MSDEIRASSYDTRRDLMYYHKEPMKYVKYGKIYPYFDETNDLNIHYRWLGQYCGYFPQVWLSRSHSRITGIRNRYNKKTAVLFGFENIEGFFLDYEQWEHLLSFMCMATNKLDWKSLPENYMATLADIGKIDELARRGYDEFMKLEQEIQKGDEDCDAIPDYNIFETINRPKGFDDWRDNHLFVKTDQCVVPSLNLKSAKKILCRDEKMKKQLRKMGFIEDRIKIQKFKADWV